ncbi:hypothetical protein [Pendulispora albinea]|uniref:Lipoprotein n=1 Tax=Pendulispora albinea TaxID=2741071 RepID=A0ABZ2LW56_9BACT
MALGWVCLATAAAAGAACSGSESNNGGGGGACPPPSQKYPLTAAYADHACLHVLHGPWEKFPADADPASTKTELRNTHYAYTVELPSTADGAHAGAVYFEPRSTEGFAFFRTSDTPFTLQTRDGAQICPVASYEVKASCSELRRVDFFDLTRKSEYPLRLGPTSESSVMVIVEAAP